MNELLPRFGSDRLTGDALGNEAEMNQLFNNSSLIDQKEVLERVPTPVAHDSELYRPLTTETVPVTPAFTEKETLNWNEYTDGMLHNLSEPEVCDSVVDAISFSDSDSPDVPDVTHVPSCMVSNVNSLQFTVVGGLPLGAMYTLTNEESGSVSIRRRVIESVSIVIVTRDGLRPYQTTIPVMLSNNLNHQADPVFDFDDHVYTGEDSISRNMSFIDSRMLNRDELSISGVTSSAIHSYIKPIFMIAPISNSELFSRGKKYIKEITSYANTVLSAFDNYSGFNLYFALTKQRYEETSLYSGFRMLLIPSSDILTRKNIYNTSSNLEYKTPLCSCIIPQLDRIAKSIPPPSSKIVTVDDVSDMVINFSRMPDHIEYAYTQPLSSNTILPSVFSNSVVTEFNYEKAPTKLILSTKDINFKFASGFTYFTRSFLDGSLRVFFYSAELSSNFDTNFPSVRALSVDSKFVGSLIYIWSNHDIVLNLSVHYNQENLIVQAPALRGLNIKNKVGHFRVRNLVISNLEQVSDSVLSQLTTFCDALMFGGDANDNSILTTINYFSQLMRTPSFENSQLPKFVHSPKSHYFGTNILEVASSTLPLDVTSKMQLHLKACTNYARNIIFERFNEFNDLPVFSRGKYDAHFYNTPVLNDFVDEADMTKYGLVSINSLSTYAYKVMQSRKRVNERNLDTRHGYGINSLVIGDISKSVKCHICELCQSMYPSLLGSLYCKATHIASQTNLITHNPSKVIRGAYTMYLLPHIKDDSFACVLVGKADYETIFGSNKMKAYKLYINEHDRQKGINALCFFALRHTYDHNNGGSFLSSDPIETKLNITPFISPRPNANARFSITAVIRDSRPSRSINKQNLKTRSTSRGVSHDKDKPCKFTRGTSVNRVFTFGDYVQNDDRKYTMQPKQTSTLKVPVSVPSIPDPTASSLTDVTRKLEKYISDFVPKTDGSTLQPVLKFFSLENKAIARMKKFKTRTSAALLKSLPYIPKNPSAKADGFFASLRPDIFRQLGPFALECFAGPDNLHMIPYCSESRSDPFSLGDIFTLSLKDYKDQVLYANPPYTPLVSEFIEFVGDSEVSIGVVCVFPDWPDIDEMIKGANLHVHNSVVIKPKTKDCKFPMFVHGDTTYPHYFNNDKPVRFYQLYTAGFDPKKFSDLNSVRF